MGGRLHVRLNGKPFKEVDCFKYLGLQVAADGVVHRMNENYRARGVLNNRGLGINVKNCVYEGVTVPMACMEQRHGV